jgi:hypothetical protein
MDDSWPIDEDAAEDAELKAWLVGAGEAGMGVIGAVNRRVEGINEIATGDPQTEVACARALELLGRTVAHVSRMLRLTAAARIRLREGTLGQVPAARAKAAPEPEWSEADYQRHLDEVQRTLDIRLNRRGVGQVMDEVIEEATEDLMERRALTCALYERLDEYEDLGSLSVREIVDEVCETLGLTPAPDIWTRESRVQQKAELDAAIERCSQPDPKYDAWVEKMTGKPVRRAGGP